MLLKNIKVQFTKLLERYWQRQLSTERSGSLNRFFEGLVLASISLTCIAIFYKHTGIYFSSLTVFATLLITLYGGVRVGITYAIILSLGAELFFVKPFGRILYDRAAKEHFIIICGLTLFVVLIISSIQLTFKKMEGVGREAEKARKDAENARQDAERANQHKTEFLSNMSHEIRTPINGIIGMAELLTKTELDEKQSRYLENIKISSKVLLSLVNDILDLSRVEEGKMQLESKPFDLGDIVREIVSFFKPIAELRGIGFDTHLKASSSLLFLGDQNRIKQVLVNLVGNALKFTHVGWVSLNIEVEEVGKNGAARINFSVKDTGIGIPRDVRGKLFQKFSQGSSSTSRQYGGSGLGLAISKQLVELMGGRIGVRSNGGKGSIFYFSIGLKPASIIETKSVEVVCSRDDVNRNPKICDKYRQPRILLAEDNYINQEITLTILKNAGYSVDVVENGVGAVDAVRKFDYAVILMDCQMPEKDGYEATRQIREEGYKTPIIALTAHAFTGDRERCKGAGMSDYISKPFTEQSLLQLVDRYISEGALGESPKPLFDRSLMRQWEDVDRKSNTGLVEKLINSYIESAPKSVEQLKKSYTENNTKLFKQEVHKFKSSNGNLGLLRLQQILEILEDEKTKVEVSDHLMEQLEVEVENAIRILREYRSEASA